jgi:hypothetical protein
VTRHVESLELRVAAGSVPTNLSTWEEVRVEEKPAGSSWRGRSVASSAAQHWPSFLRGTKYPPVLEEANAWRIPGKME